MAAKNTSTLRFDVLSLKGVPILDAFPELREYHEFVSNGEGDNNALLAFAILYSDANSEYRDSPIDFKRQQCMKKAGIADDDPRRPDIQAMRHKGVLRMVVEYVRLQDWLEYATLYHGREHAWRLVAMLSTPMADDLGDEKEQKAIKTKNENLEFALEKVGELDRRWKALWMNEEEVQAEAQRMTAHATLTAESRARNRQFVPASA